MFSRASVKNLSTVKSDRMAPNGLPNGMKERSHPDEMGKDSRDFAQDVIAVRSIEVVNALAIPSFVCIRNFAVELPEC